MEIWEAIVLGITQGLTEFLPVSSSGHLVLVRNMMDLAEVPLFFDVMLHLGTLVAVVVVLFKEIIGLFAHPVKNRLLVLIFASIPAGIVGLLFNDAIEGAYSGALLGICFMITAGILVLSEFLSARAVKKRGIDIKSGMVMGLMQTAALFPGISRSGSTIAGGLFLGTDRSKAASFAFLMSIPMILGSVLVEGMEVMETGMGDVSTAALIAGTAAAAVSGFFAVKWMLNLIKKRKLFGFAIYVAAVGIFVLIDQSATHLIF